MWTALNKLNLNWDNLELKLNGNLIKVDLYKKQNQPIYMDYGHKLIFNQKVFYYKDLIITEDPDGQIQILEIINR